MAAAKRKAHTADSLAPKKLKTNGQKKTASQDRSRKLQPAENSFSSSDQDSFDGFDEETGHSSRDDVGYESDPEPQVASANILASSKTVENGLPKAGGSTSRESHAKQRALAQERKAAKPHADSVARSKKIWERLRVKSAVPREERKKLVAELFSIITGNVKDLVFKHDSVRVIQTALKYANQEQRKEIARELKGDYKALAESKYAKFLIGKLIVYGDKDISDMIIPEFYGYVKKLIRHPESSWIVDDIYRGIATSEQKARLLREWYGPEFVIFQAPEGQDVTANLSVILEKNPEKRGPIMQHLHELINQLIQKKTTGFTMLHDAMLQCFLNTGPGTQEAAEFIEMLKDDEAGDCLKNLAFTKSGSRLVCLCLAYASAKDRKQILRFYKDTIKMLAADGYGYIVILTAFDVIDDTVMSSKAIFPELLGKDLNEHDRYEQLLEQANHTTSRIPLLYLLSVEKPKWLLSDDASSLLKEVHGIRKSTSKKDPETRRQELVKGTSDPLLGFIAARTEVLLSTSYGCQFITEVLLGAGGNKQAALQSLANLAKDKSEVLDYPAIGRMLKTLVLGGRFNPTTKTVESIDPPLGFHNILYRHIASDVESWATGSNSFVVVGLTEADGFNAKDELLKMLKRCEKALTRAAQGDKEEKKPNKGASLLLEKIR